MAVFAFETEKTPALIKFINETELRLKEKGIVKNPFVGRIIKIPSCSLTSTCVVDIDPVYPRIWVFGVPLFIIILFIAKGWTPWAIPPLGILATGLLWTKYFYIIFIKLGLKRAGHNKKIKLITNHTTISRLIDIIV